MVSKVNVANLSGFFSYYHFDWKHNSSFLWILSMEDSKHELSTINMFYPVPPTHAKKKNYCHIMPLPPHNSHLSKTATFFCLQGGHCGEVWLCINSGSKHCQHSLNLSCLHFFSFRFLYYTTHSNITSCLEVK